MSKSLRLFLPTVLLALASCGGGSDPAVGTWKIDGTATLEANKAAMTAEMSAEMGDQPEGMEEMALAMMEAMISQMDMTLTLEADGTMSGVAKMPNPMGGEAAENSMTGTWAANGDKLTLKSVEEGSDKEETMSATVDGDTLTTVMDDAGEEFTIIFTRG